MNNRKTNPSTLFAAENNAFSLTDLISHMNRQYIEYKTKSGAETNVNWTITKNLNNIEYTHPHYRIDSGNFYRTELFNFLAEQKLQPEIKTEGDKKFIVVTEANLLNAKTTQKDASHFLFTMHKKINEMLEQTKSASLNYRQ